MDWYSEFITYMFLGRWKKIQIRYPTKIYINIIITECLISSKIWKYRHEKKDTPKNVCFHYFFILIFIMYFFNSWLKKWQMMHYIILPGINANADILIVKLPQCYLSYSVFLHLYSFFSVSNSSCFPSLPTCRCGNPHLVIY